jgi:uncharacterized protein (TIGR00290 family)
MESVLLFWSGGKDSAMCLHELTQSGAAKVVGLVVTLDGDGRVGMHGVCSACVRQQADALDLPLIEIAMPKEPSNTAYLEAVREKLSPWHDRGVKTLAFGDVFLEDIRAWRVSEFAELGYQCLFPIWGRDTTDLAREFISLGYSATVVTVDSTQLSGNFCGRAFDLPLLRELPGRIDPAGEQGEFHTFVSDGPGFKGAVKFEVSGTRRDRHFVVAELVCECPA